MSKKITRALISVSDKEGVVKFADQLHRQGIEIFSTGGTFKLLCQNQIPAIEISEYTNFPEMMDGRVKTLHPKVHGGILGRRGIDDEIMSSHDIKNIDLVVVNLYPFQETIAKPNCDLALAIENIDIGGPTMVRAAAKNHTDVTVIVNPSDYDRVIQELEANQGEISANQRFNFAVKAFEHTAQYDAAIANYLGCKISEPASGFPRTYNSQYVKVEDLRYGENPHQQAAFYKEANYSGASVANSIQIQGKALSFNNVADTDAALECVQSLESTACVIVKHANPCGAALGQTLLEAYEKAYATDPTSAFGGIIAFNHALDAETAELILGRQFVEVIIAPDYQDDCLKVLTSKPNIRVLKCGSMKQSDQPGWDYKRVAGGLLVQDRDLSELSDLDLKVMTKRAPTQQEISDLLFSWKVAKFVKSNAIVYGHNGQTIGVGAGQMSRVYSARVAAMKATDENLQVEGSVMASDAFFPFRDSVDAAAEAGITAIIQPGGSIRDEEVIQAADEAGMAMVFTGIRNFRH